jgi:uncharacterized protein
MSEYSIDRRQFAASATALAFGGLAACAPSLGSVRTASTGNRYGALVPDPNGLLDLPPGFSYRIISSLGDPMDDGDTVPDRADGMGCFSGPTPGSVILVRNHELSARHDSSSGFAANRTIPHYGTVPNGRALPGGTTTLEVELASGRILRQHRSLAGTIRNCAGGQTPWRSWLTCEEDVTKPGATSNKDHGYIFEVPADARGPIDPMPLRAMGRFNHEAVAIDPATGIAYLTEDRDDGLLYRFIPTVPGQLARGGRLEALALTDGIADTRNWTAASVTKGQALSVRWIPLDNPEAPDDDLRARGAALGATKFARGEGIWFGRNELYFTCTSGGAARLGQIFKLRIAQRGGLDQLTLHFESAATDQLNFGDNLTIMPDGDLLVCEDQYGAVVDNHLRIITMAGEAFPFGRIRIQTEPAGACFSPSGRELFVNLYSPTKTLMVTGPW